MKPSTGAWSLGSTTQRVTVVHKVGRAQARTETLAESPGASHRVESTSHSSRPRLARARAVTLCPPHVSVVSVVSTGDPPATRVKWARISVWRFRTTARLPLVSTGATNATSGAVPDVTLYNPWSVEFPSAHRRRVPVPVAPTLYDTLTVVWAPPARNTLPRPVETQVTTPPSSQDSVNVSSSPPVFSTVKLAT